MTSASAPEGRAPTDPPGSAAGGADRPVLAVTVLGDDRPGIVAELTAALAGLGGNLEDSTMTLLRGHFAMVVLVRTGASTEQVAAALAGLETGGRLSVDVRELADTTATDPQRRDPERPGAGPAATDPDTGASRVWALRVHGADRPGIVAAITRVIAEHGGNIVDLGTRLGADLYVLLAEVVLPQGSDPQPLTAALRGVADELGVRVHFDPVDDEVL